MSIVDFTTGTTVETGANELTVTSTQVTFTGLAGTSSGDVFQSMPTVRAGDFRMRVGPINISSAPSDSSSFSPVVLSNSPTGGGDSTDMQRPAIHIRYYRETTNPTLALLQFTASQNGTYSSTNYDTGVSAALLPGNNWYLDLERIGSSMTVKIYSDAYSTLIDTLAITLTEIVTINYTMIASRAAFGGSAVIAGTIQNLDTAVTTGVSGSGATTEASGDTASGSGSSITTGTGNGVEASPDSASGSGTVTQPTAADINALTVKTALSGAELLAITDSNVAKATTPSSIATLLYGGSGTVAALASVSKTTFRMAYATDGRRSGQGLGAGTGCPVWSDGTNWRTFYDNTVVAA